MARRGLLCPRLLGAARHRGADLESLSGAGHGWTAADRTVDQAGARLGQGGVGRLRPLRCSRAGAGPAIASPQAPCARLEAWSGGSAPSTAIWLVGSSDQPQELAEMSCQGACRPCACGQLSRTNNLILKRTFIDMHHARLYRGMSSMLVGEFDARKNRHLPVVRPWRGAESG